MTRGRKLVLWSGGALLLIVVAVLSAVSWVLFSTSGARWVAAQATSRFAPMVKYARIDGTLAGELTVTDFRFEGDPTVAKLRIARMTVDPTLRMLFSRVLRIERATVEGLVLTLPEQEKPDQPDEPLWVEPPVEVIVKDFALRDGRVLKGNEKLFSARQLAISAHWSRDAIEIDRLELLPGDIEGRLSVTGRVTPAGQTLRGVLDAKWTDVVIPETLAGRVIASAGELRFEGTPDQYVARGELDVGPPGDPTHAVLDISGTDARAELRTVELRQRAGRLALKGSVEFQPVAWNLDAEAREFDPGALLAGWPGRLNLSLSSHGELADAGPRGHLDIARLDGTLRGRPISGGGQLDFAAPDTLSGDVNVRSGRSRLALRGRAHSEGGVDANVELAVASLNDWIPETSGSLAGAFRVRGAWPKLAIEGTATGKSLAMGEAKIASLRVEADVKTPLDPSGSVKVEAGKVSAAGFEFERVTANADGSQSKHRLALDADGERLDVSVALAGALQDGAWRAELSMLTLQAPDVPRLALRAPARIVVDGARYEISEACLADDSGAALCAAGALQADGTLAANYSFEKVPLGLANALAPDALPGQLRGELAGRGAVKRGTDGQWLGDARVQSADAQLVGEDEPGASVLGQRTWLLYRDLDLNAQLRGNDATATVTAALQDGGSLDANVQVGNLMGEAPGLGGSVNASLPTLAPFAAFAPGIANLDGAVSAKIRLGGTFAAPEVTGTVDATKLQADLGKLGIELRDGRIEAEAKQGGGFVLGASVASGKGHLELAGTTSARGVIDARIRGQNFQAADIPAANVVLTPDLALTGDPKGYLLTGDVTIPRARVNLQKLPQDEPPGVSPDVVVVRDGKVVVRTAEPAALPLTATINVKLGETIEVEGYGLDATVSGQLAVREAPGVPTTGSGTLQVAGRYKAYGQDLTIKDGRLLFAGSPLDNPRLAIVAMREINEDLSTGLRIAGSVQRPIITVISDPNVGEADALSYLVTGRSLNEVGTASGGSQDRLASATRSLEGAGAGLVAKRIGQRLGLDETTVEENEMIGGSALTIGEYLSPRLYLSYGVGLFEPGEVIALRYKLSDDIGVRVQRGSEETRAGVEYRIER